MARITITQWVHNQLLLAADNWELCVDATAGKGNDTLFLCENSKENGKVVAFDIQKQALKATEELLKKHNYHVMNPSAIGQENDIQIQLLLDSHESMDQYLQKDTVDIMMFNLGYLPGGDHALATMPDTTITAMEKGLALLKPGGIMSICIYSGGDSGFAERDAVLDFLEKLDHKAYTVIVSHFFNKPNHPPVPVLVRKEK